MPFCQIGLTATKPEGNGYPENPQTLGDHLKKARLDRNLLQRDVATQLGVRVESVMNWELNRHEPDLRSIPGIIEIIGYDPLPQPKTMGEDLVRKRTLLGLTQRESGNQIGIDQTTLARWERDERLPWGEGLGKLKLFLGSPVPQKNPDTLGQQIRVKRNSLGLTQLALAKRFGIKRHTVSMWETDRQKPGGALLSKVVQVLGVESIEIQ